MPLKHVTFTGLDAFTSVDDVADLAESHPIAEFGILMGTNTGSPKHLRFPPKSIVERWLKNAFPLEIPLSVHLCGKYSRAVNGGLDRKDAWNEISHICHDASVQRLQINSVKYDFPSIVEFAERMKKPIIVQHRKDYSASPPPVLHPNIQYLLDRSGGRGIDGIKQWGRPWKWDTMKCGYSGGISPDNVEDAVAFAQNLEQDVWIDMESGVRTGDKFDVAKVEDVLISVEKAMGQQP